MTCTTDRTPERIASAPEAALSLDHEMIGAYDRSPADRRVLCSLVSPEELGHQANELLMPTERTVGRQLDFPAALELADIAISCDDLRWAIAFLDRLLATYLRKQNKWADQVLAEALWTAAVIKYARAFDHRGAKTRKLNATALYKGVDGAAETHRRFIKLRNQHTAHDRNPLNQCKIGVDAKPQLGAEHSMRICYLEIYSMPNIDEAECLYNLGRLGLERTEGLRGKQESKVLEQAKRLPPQYLESRQELTVRLAKGDQVLGENRVGWPREKIQK